MVRQLRIKVVPVRFRRVVIPEYHIYTLIGYSHDKRTLYKNIGNVFVDNG